MSSRTYGIARIRSAGETLEYCAQTRGFVQFFFFRTHDRTPAKQKRKKRKKRKGNSERLPHGARRHVLADRRRVRFTATPHAQLAVSLGAHPLWLDSVVDPLTLPSPFGFPSGASASPHT